MDIDRSLDEFKDFYYRQLEQGFPVGTMVRIRNMGSLLARASRTDYDALMLDVRRDALMRPSLAKRLSVRHA